MKVTIRVAVVVATTLFGVVPIALQLGDPTVPVLVAAPTLSAIAAGAAAVRGRAISGRERIAWYAVATAMAMMTPIYLVDHLGWAFAEYTLIGLAYLFAAVAVIIVPLPTASVYDRVVASIDSLSIGVVVATATYWVVATADLETASVTGWIVVNAASMAMVGYVALRRGQGRTEWPIVWLAVGIGGYLAGSLVTAASPGGYEIGGSADIAYLTGLMGFAIAPIVAGTSGHRRVLQPVRWTHVLIPYYFIAALTLVLIAYLVLNWSDDPTRSVVILGLVTTMVIAILRQLVMISGQRRKMELEQRGVIATVSHELRTPLTSIVGFLDMLEAWDAFDEEEKIEMMTLMRGQSHVLARVVDDLISLAREEIDSTDLNKEAVHVADLLGYAIAAVPELDQVEASFDIPSGLQMNADRDRMLQVLANFLSNAVAYGRGAVDIVARLEPTGTVVEVHDNGPGVSDIYQLVIWERFERGDQRQSSIPGSGIGLSVARGIVRSHGGEATYRQSERLGGACFAISIPHAMNGTVRAASQATPAS